VRLSLSPPTRPQHIYLGEESALNIATKNIYIRTILTVELKCQPPSLCVSTICTRREVSRIMTMPQRSVETLLYVKNPREAGVAANNGMGKKKKKTRRSPI
jgi:hypothetical protein